MRLDPKAKKKIILSRQDRVFLRNMAICVGLLAVVVILDGLGVI